MNRRNVLIGSAIGSVLVASGGILSIKAGNSDVSLTMDSSIQALDKLISKKVVTLGDWNLSQILIHCAQSIEFSMGGFPEHKSEVFKSTVGKLAFAFFSTKGEMTHGLNEVIPGAPAIDSSADLNAASTRLRSAMLNFQAYEGPLASHFAFGSLSKQEYEQAHAMHFYNHLLEIAPASKTV